MDIITLYTTLVYDHFLNFFTSYTKFIEVAYDDTELVTSM